MKRVLKHRAWAAAFVLLVVIGGLLFARASVSAQSQANGISITLHFDNRMELNRVQFGELQPDIVIVDKGGNPSSPRRAAELAGFNLENNAAALKEKGEFYKKDLIKMFWSPSNSGCVTVDGVSYCW